MDKCKQCKFYTRPFLGKPVCKKFSNVQLTSGKDLPFKIPAAFKICKGYFFEYSKDDLYKTLDDSLSDSTFPFE